MGRLLTRLGVEGQLVSRRYGSIRVYGEEEVERLRAYFRERMPRVEGGPDDAAGDKGTEERQVDGGEGQLALPPAGHVAEFLDLLEDLRNVIARASAGEGKAIAAVEEVGGVRAEVQQLRGAFSALVDENRQLREVLAAVAARLPGPPAPPLPPPRLRWRVVAEVVLIGWVVLLAVVLGAVVLQRLADVGVVTLPAWWPIG